MIDLHAHVLPGVDDGPATMDDSIALVALAARCGTRTIVATPHVDDRSNPTPAEIAAGLERVRAELRAAGIDIEVLAGAEVAIPRLTDLSDDDLEGLCLGSSPYLLVESPLSPGAADPEPGIRALLARGRRVVLAHPERSPIFQRDPGQLARLAAAGVLTSITASALDGRFGRTARAYAVELLRDGLAHSLASDAHDDDRRPPGIGGALAAVERELPGIRAREDWLTQEAPAAILGGLPPPAPPPLTRRGPVGWRRLLRR
jgi:protein-tyrosine phosphatase